MKLSENRRHVIHWTLSEIGETLRTAWTAFTLDTHPGRANSINQGLESPDKLGLILQAQAEAATTLRNMATSLASLEQRVEALEG
jgi:hypothetical protein